MSGRIAPPLPPSLAAAILPQVQAGISKPHLPLRGYEMPPRRSTLDIALVHRVWLASGACNFCRHLPRLTVEDLGYILEHLPPTFGDAGFRKAVQTDLRGTPCG